MDEEYNQIATAVSLSNRPAKIFTANVSAFCEFKDWLVQKQLLHFTLADIVLPHDLVHKFIEPNDLVDFSFNLIISAGHAHNRHAKWK